MRKAIRAGAFACLASSSGHTGKLTAHELTLGARF
jgi:hypothetical protein